MSGPNSRTLAREVRDGWSIIVVAPSQRLRAVMDEVLEACDEIGAGVAKVHTGLGRNRVDSRSGGSARFVSSPWRLRGASADRVYIDPRVARTPELIAQAHAVVAASPDAAVVAL